MPPEMRSQKRILHLLPFSLLACVVCGRAQLQPEPPDPLAQIRDAAKSNVQACSTTGETLCERVAPKIIANAQGASPLEENVRGLAKQIHEGKIASSSEAVAWAVAAFQAAGFAAHVEQNNVPTEGLEANLRMRQAAAAAFRAAGLKGHSGGNDNPVAGDGVVPRVQQAVVAEFRGREKPEEWILIGTRLGLYNLDTVTMASNAALVIEAARDIQITGTHPRRSIRFVLLIDEDWSMLGSWAYVRAHRHELDRARAALFLEGGAHRVTGYTTGARADIGPGLREATKPIESWGIAHSTVGPSLSAEDFDFFLEGVPAMTAEQEGMRFARRIPDFSEALDTLDLQQLQRNTAIAAVTAFGIAERAEPLGPRQSRPQIESLLKTTGVEQEMEIAGLWPLWESGQRGRVPLAAKGLP